MFETLFGPDVSPPVRFLLAFVVVLVLIGLTAWIVRRFGSSRLGGGSGRNRAPRLAVIDSAAVDNRRRLVIVRRDNVEHLLMIGGPTDVVVETNIVRAMPQRDGGRGPEPTWTPPEAAPVTAPTPMPAAAGSRTVRAEEPPAAPIPVVAPTPEPALRPSPRAADTLAGLAAELSTRPAPPSDLDTRSAPPPPPRPSAPLRAEPSFRAEPTARPAAAPPQASAETAGDPDLNGMTQRLEAALRRPTPAATPRAAEPRLPVPPIPIASMPPPAPSLKTGADTAPNVTITPAPAAPAPAAAEPKADRTPDRTPDRASTYDSLEQEMASLLGRPNQKT
ncbi:MAG TPA: flagellar biosynthetic protein FliO [Xanthobacteraceae bacterium]|nr:flagellar biosynthetic protein FliO [Xanthobacteraceae bacterium]